MHSIQSRYSQSELREPDDPVVVRNQPDNQHESSGLGWDPALFWSDRIDEVLKTRVGIPFDPFHFRCHPPADAASRQVPSLKALKDAANASYFHAKYNRCLDTQLYSLWNAPVTVLAQEQAPPVHILSQVPKVPGGDSFSKRVLSSQTDREL